MKRGRKGSKVGEGGRGGEKRRERKGREEDSMSEGRDEKKQEQIVWNLKFGSNRNQQRAIVSWLAGR